MDVRIGVVHAGKELSVEFDGAVDDVVGLFDAALAGGAPILWIPDAKGRRVGVPADKLAYVEIDDGSGSKRVGFGR
jgi:hypothetical protein